MSERTSTNAGRLDNWDANQRAHERNQWEDALYAEAGKSDFTDDAKVRVEEAQAYEDHMSGLAGRAVEHDTIDEDHLDAIDRTIQSDVRLRRMVALANQIREAADYQLVDGDDAERMMNSLKDKEDRLQELLEGYMDNGQASEHEKDEIMNRIVNMTRETSPSIDSGQEQDADKTAEHEGDNDQEQDDETEFDKSDDTPEENDEDGDKVRLTEEELSAKRAKMVKSGLTGLEVGNMSDEEIEAYQFEHDQEHGEEEETPRMTKEALIVKRAKMVKSGLSGLEVGNMSDEEIEKYNLVESEAAAELDYPETSETDESEDVETDDLDEKDSEADGSDINTDWVEEYEDGELELLEHDTRNWAQRHWDDLRRYGFVAYAGGQKDSLKSWLDNRRNSNYENTRDTRKAAALGLLALTAATAVWAGIKIYKNIDTGSTPGGTGYSGGGSGGNTLTNDAAGLTGDLETPSGIDDVDTNDTGVESPETGDDTAGEQDQSGSNEMTDNEALNALLLEHGVSLEAFNIPQGSGGEALMNRMNVDKSIWYANEHEFLRLFPDEAMTDRTNNAHVWLKKPGQMSTEATKFWMEKVAASK